MQTFHNGDDNTLFMPGLGPLRDEAVVNCHRYSAFADTQLDVLLRSNCIRTTVFVGATTNCAVETTAREAADRDYHVIVAGNCVAAPDVESTFMSQHSKTSAATLVPWPTPARLPRI